MPQKPKSRRFALERDQAHPILAQVFVHLGHLSGRLPRRVRNLIIAMIIPRRAAFVKLAKQGNSILANQFELPS